MSRYPLRCFTCSHRFAEHRFWDGRGIWCRGCRDFRGPVFHELSTSR
jgi:hypothetical protein